MHLVFLFFFMLASLACGGRTASPGPQLPPSRDFRIEILESSYMFGRTTVMTRRMHIAPGVELAVGVSFSGRRLTQPPLLVGLIFYCTRDVGDTPHVFLYNSANYRISALALRHGEAPLGEDVYIVPLLAHEFLSLISAEGIGGLLFRGADPSTHRGPAPILHVTRQDQATLHYFAQQMKLQPREEDAER